MTHIPDSQTHLFLLPGQIYFGGHEGFVETILGSCVAVTLWHAKKTLSGMCHFVLPSTTTAQLEPASTRYGSAAIESLRCSAEKYGTFLSEYRVGVYGGGNMFPCQKNNQDTNIGDRNVSLALELLSKYGATVAEQRTGGRFYRKIKMNGKSGQVIFQETAVDCSGPSKYRYG